MTKNPYLDLPNSAFWKTAVAQATPFAPLQLFKPKWRIGRETKVATAGSCFAQHITRALRSMKFDILDVEPPTFGLPHSDWLRFGYGTYSARYGNIYTAQQLLTIAREALGGFRPVERIWKRGDRFFDAMRPGVEPDGLCSPEEVLEHRERHLRLVRELFLTMDLLIFTLGLTEGWVSACDGAAYPICPGTVAGDFVQSQHRFRNFGFQETLNALNEFRQLVSEHRQGREFQMLLTVSPVPLTATASGCHVLQANAYSKAVLRAVAGELAELRDDIDYFPSFELITNPAARSMLYENNLRSVRREGIKFAMEMFFRAYCCAESPSDGDHCNAESAFPVDNYGNLQCEEYLLEAFGD